MIELGMERKERTFFDEENRLAELSAKHDRLEDLEKLIEWEGFRPILEEPLTRQSAKEKGGRPGYDVVMIFKVLVLRELYQISDDELEYMIMDRLSFQRFIGIGLSEKVPDAKTIWNYRDRLTKAGVMKKLVKKFHFLLREKKFIVNQGVLVDASIIPVPIQQNSREENQAIKEEKAISEWSENQNRQKDTDARWTQKGGQNYFGYKNHIKVDAKSKLILCNEVTSAEVHDSQMLERLLDKEDEGQSLYGDSAYRSEAIEGVLKERGIKSKIHEKGCRYKKLTGKQKKLNSKRSRIRARVEHVFGFMKMSMRLGRLRAIGIKRIEGIIDLINLCYNMCHYEYLVVP